MSNSIQSVNNYSPEQMKLITDVVARGATPDELKLFLYRCHNLGLDPLKPGQIYFIKYGNSPGTIVVGIEGFRARAVKTGKLSGIKRGSLKDDKGNLIGAWAEVFRSDWKECAREEVPLNEYNTGKGNWAKMPETMIKKIAEAAALRMAFPDDLGGIYTNEEMDQAEKDAQRIAPSQPGPDDGDTVSSGYRIPFGKFTGRSLEEVGTRDLGNYVQFLEGAAAKDKKVISGQVKDFIDKASSYIAAYEIEAADRLRAGEDLFSGNEE